jgi:hypothetical protein
MSEDEMKASITAAIAETGAAGMKDMGKVIGVLRAKFAGQMDFGKASGLVKGSAVVLGSPNWGRAAVSSRAAFAACRIVR